MHPEAYEWVARFRTAHQVAVLDLGGRDINGSPRPHFPNADPYTVVDIRDDYGVDVVADAATWVPDREYDIVVCCEVFEHTPVWPQILHTAHKALRPGGRLIATMAGPGRVPHSAYDGGEIRPEEHYANIEPERLRRALEDSGFAGGVVDYRADSRDTRCVAAK